GIMILYITYIENPVVKSRRIRITILGWRIAGALYVLTAISEISFLFLYPDFPYYIFTMIFIGLLALTTFILAVKLPEVLLFTEVQILRAKRIYQKLSTHPPAKKSLLLNYIQNLPPSLFIKE
ncbi:MAG: hypothetical protein KAR20_25405, partial [Candidatus Heimdallarchaeota archaeon]|nr:hypothetical protein [Candidatus Heimdallarchaeota archaeon]